MSQTTEGSTGQTGQEKTRRLGETGCYSCSRRGHLAKNCPNKDYRAPQRNGKVNEVHDSTSNDAYPTKSVKIGQLVTNAVIDSGASVSCISYKMLCEAFPHGFDLTDTSAVLTGPSSLPLKTSGVVKTYICFDDHVVPCSLHVLDVDNDTFNFLSDGTLCVILTKSHLSLKRIQWSLDQ